MPRKLHAEETENRELGFHVLLKLSAKPTREKSTKPNSMD